MTLCSKDNCYRVSVKTKQHNDMVWRACPRHLKWLLKKYYKDINVITEYKKHTACLDEAISQDDAAYFDRERKHLKRVARYGVAQPSILNRLTRGRL